MAKIPTAEKVMKSHHNHCKDEDGNEIYYEWSVKNAMIEFAKLHVEAALKAASKSSKVRKDTYVMGRGTTEVEQMFNYNNGTSHYVDQVSILNSYPLENIK